MRIRLIQPAMGQRPMDTALKTRMSPSLGLLTLCQLTPPGHEVVIENENVGKIDFEEGADLVAITVTVDVLDRAVEIAREFRKRGVTVVAGGIQVTCDPESASGHFDAIGIGMAERIWPRILEDREKGALKPVYCDMEGLSGAEIVSPAYGAIDRDRYLFTNIVTTSRGCPFRCDFCYNSCRHTLGTYINRPVRDVMKDIQTIGTRHVMFVDDNFIGNPAWTRSLLEEMKPLGLKWNAAVSSNIGEIPGLLDEMKEAGCQSLFIGFESISKGSVESVHKVQNSVRRYEKLVDDLHRRGIMVNASFVFGLDEDDVTVFRRTLDWVVKNRIETVTAHILTPYPGTRLHAALLEQGRITDPDLSHYNTAHVVFVPKKMTGEELYAGYLWFYRELYAMGNILRRMPASSRQWIPYLTFSIFYRKFGKLTARLCEMVSFRTIGKLSSFLAYRTRDTRKGRQSPKQGKDKNGEYLEVPSWTRRISS